MSRVIQAIRRPPSGEAMVQLVRYVLVAGCGYLLAMMIYAAELVLGVPPYPSIIVAFVANGVFNFVAVRRWAFPTSGRKPASEFSRFCTVALCSLLINYGSFAVLYSILGLPPILAQALAIAIAAPFGFLANRLWSFRAA